MKRTDLHQDPAKSLGRLLKGARGVGEAAHTRPTGIVHLGDGDVVWENGDGLTSVKDLPSAIDVEKLLQEGLTTETRRTTVSTSQPSATDGFPEGAYWTQTTTASDNTVKGVWKLTDGQWVAQDLPGTNLTAFPYADIGLLNVAVLSAQIITSGYFRTATTGKRIEIDSLGVRAYDESGNNTVNLNGFENLITGGFRTAVSGVRTEVLNSIWGGYFSGIRLWTSTLPNPAELKTNSGPYQAGFKTYGTGSLFLTSARGNVDQSRSELALAPNMVDINMTGADGATLNAGMSISPTEIKMEHYGGKLTLRSGSISFISSTASGHIEAGDAGATISAGEGNASMYAGVGKTVILGAPNGAMLMLSASGVSFTHMVGDRFTFNGSPVVVGQTITSGSINVLRAPNRYTVRTTTDTPTASWGFLDVVETGNGVIEQRWTTDTGDFREWVRRSTGATTWTAWQASGASTAGAGMGTATGWALNSASVREKNGVIQLTFAVIPNGNAGPGEHTVATTNAALNALAAIRQQPLPWYAGGQSTLAGTSMWDKNDGRIYLKTTQTLPAGTTCYHSLTFI